MKNYEEKLFLIDLYDKVAEGEEDIRMGRYHDAFEVLEELKEKYHV